MVEDVLARGEDREHRRRHAGDLAHQRGRPRAHLDAELRLEAVAVEEVRLPAVVVGDLDLVLGDVLEVRQRVAILEHMAQLVADDLPVVLDVLDPGKRSSWKNVASPTSERRPMNRSIGARMRSPTAIVVSTVRSHSDLDTTCSPPVLAASCQPAAARGLGSHTSEGPAAARGPTMRPDVFRGCRWGYVAACPCRDAARTTPTAVACEHRGMREEPLTPRRGEEMTRSAKLALSAAMVVLDDGRARAVRRGVRTRRRRPAAHERLQRSRRGQRRLARSR